MGRRRDARTVILAIPASPRLRVKEIQSAPMAGYSGRPLVQKLGVKPNVRAVITGAPDDFLKQLEPLPDGVKFLTPAAKKFDFALVFLTKVGDLTKIKALAPRLEPDGMLWIAWPKKTANPSSELSENLVREAAFDASLVDVKVIAIDEKWSGLKLVYRLKDRPALRK